MSKQYQGVKRVAAEWLPLVVMGLFASAMHAQSAGIAPLVSGDCAVSSSGVMTCSKTSGTSFAASATTDTTNASNITSGVLSSARTPALSGDVTKAAGSATTTVTAINGMNVPTTAGIAATNTAGQIVAATAAQTRALVCSGTAATNYYCDGNTGAWVAIPWTANTNANIAQYSTVASAASTPAMLVTGALYTGGTGTTTTPHWYVNQGATSPTTWNTNGTHFGINTASGFSGNLLDFHVNGGASVFSVNSTGTLFANSITTGALGNGNAASVSLASTGLVIARNIADANVAATVNQANASSTGNIQNWQAASSTVATMTQKGVFQSQSTTGGFAAPLYTPASSSATCTAGTVAWDANYLYLCKATNTWMRSALSAF